MVNGEDSVVFAGNTEVEFVPPNSSSDLGSAGFDIDTPMAFTLRTVDPYITFVL